MKIHFTNIGRFDDSRGFRNLVWMICLLFGLTLVVPAGAQEFSVDPRSGSERFHLMMDGPKLLELHENFELTIEGVWQDGKLIAPWDAILGGRVNDVWQREFDELRTLVGVPISRMRRGMESGDWRLINAGMDEIDWNRIHDCARWSAFWLAADTLIKLEHGQRDEALLSMIKVQPILADVTSQTSELARLPMISWMAVSNSDLTPRPLPIWFDPEAVLELRRRLDEFAETSSTTTIEIHAAALALSGRDYEALQARVQQWSAGDNETLSRWATLFPIFAAIQRRESSSDIIRLEQSLETTSGTLAWVTRYWLNVTMTERARSSQQFRRAVVNWLDLAGETRKVDQEFSAAAIYQALMIASGQRWYDDETRLSEHLLKAYPETYHARQHFLERQNRSLGPYKEDSGG